MSTLDRIVADASVFMAVALEEPEKAWILKATRGFSLVAPEILHYEIGNGLIASLRRKKLRKDEVLPVYQVAQSIPVNLVSVKIPEALRLAALFDIYAYDAYYLQCAKETGGHLLSLDERMNEVARSLKIKLVEEAP